MAESGGSAATRGLVAGLGLGQQFLDAADRRKDRELQLADRQEERAWRTEDRRIQADRQRAQDARMERQDARQIRQDADNDIDAQLRFVDQDVESLKNEYAGLLQQAGNDPRKIDPGAVAQWKSRFEGASSKRDSLRTERFRPQIERQAAEAADDASRVATGQTLVDDLPSARLYNMVQFQTRRPVDDFISGDGIKPSTVRQGILDVQAGMETGNEGLMLRGLNVVFKPELMTGVGQQSHDGSEIIDKEIFALAPHPNLEMAAQGFLVPVLEMTVRRPDGAIGKYRAPVTEDRSSYFGNEASIPKAINLKDGLDRMGQLGTLEASLNQPNVKERLLKGKEEAGTDNDEAFKHFARLGGKLPPKKPVERERITVDGKVIERTLDPETKEITKTETLGLAGTSKDVREAAGLGGGTKGGKGGAGGGLGVPSSEKTGEAVLAGLSAADARIVKGLADGSIKASDISTKDNRRERMLSLAKQYDPQSGVKEPALPATVTKLLVDARDNAMTIDNLNQTFKSSFAGKGVYGIGADKQMEISGNLGIDKDAVAWWKRYRKQSELVERHALFGAALTPGEQASWRSADVGPGMDPDVVEESLKTRAELAKKVLDFTRQDQIDAGHSESRINAIANRAAPTPDDTDQRKSGKLTAEGQPTIIVNPKTGEKRILKDGKWQPMK